MNRKDKRYLSFIPVPALVIIILALYLIVKPSVFYEPPWLLPITNTIFVTVVFLIVAYIAMRNYKATGRIQILLMGCGVLAFGIGGVIAGFARSVPGIGANLNVTVYNTGALVGAIFHFAAALILLAGISAEVGSERKDFWLVSSYVGSTVLMALFTMASLGGTIPPFFIQGIGPTTLRQWVLGSADILFAFSFLIFMGSYLRNREVFLYWYSLALALTSISLSAFFIESAVGSPIGWAGRFSQYLGGIYFLIAVLTAMRSAQVRRTSFEDVLTASLSPAEEKFRALAEHSPDIIERFDRDMKYIYVNQAGLRLYGKPPGSIIGKTIGEVGFAGPYVNLLREGIQRVFETTQSKEVEHSILTKDGTRFYQSHCVPEFGVDGAVVNVLVVSHDLTERKRAEEALCQAKNDLEIRVKERTAELLQTNDRLKEENQERLRTEQLLRLEEARLDTLLHLSQISEAPLEEISGFTLEQAIGLTHSKIGFLGFLNEDESVYTLHAVSKDVVKECNVTGDPLQWHVVGAGLWADAIRERKTLFVNDYSKPHPRKKGFPCGHPYVARFMVVPILEGEKIVAVAGVGNKASEYEKSDERQIVLLLSGMWRYVQKNRSREELQKAYDELEEKVNQRTVELTASTAALQESQKDLTRAQEVGQIGSWRLDVHRNVLTWSDENHRIFGVAKGRPMTYETFLGIVHPDDRQYVDTQWKAGLLGAPYDVEHRIMVDGQVKWVREKAYLEFDEAGELRGGFGITQDITERKRADEELCKSRDELELRVRQRTAELEQAYQRLLKETEEKQRLEEQLRQAQKMEAIGTLSGGIAHDLNNIFAPIVINSELVLLDLDKNSELHNNLQLILQSGLRGKDLVTQLLLFSRKSEQKQQNVALSPIIKETFKLLRSSLPTTIQLRLHLETDSDIVYADPSQIQQVIMNLCTNAAYSMRRTKGSIDISLQGIAFGSDDLLDPDMEAGDYLVLSVKDTGCGMDEEVKKPIFEPFFTTKPLGEGTGLGLSVVYGIVKSHKGKITVYSEPGRGSIFRVYLPKADTGVSAKAENVQPIPGGKERILVVDDEESIVYSIQNMLQHLGYKVTALMDSREASKLFSADPSQFDLVMTDQTMPFMTGEDLGKELMGIRPDIPVILCTGYSDSISSEQAAPIGFRGFIMKPFTVREGAELVRRVLDKRRIQ